MLGEAVCGEMPLVVAQVAQTAGAAECIVAIAELLQQGDAVVDEAEWHAIVGAKGRIDLEGKANLVFGWNNRER